MDKVYTYVKNKDNVTLQISNLCYDSVPCQHIIVIISQRQV
jgi:hypothetical protein